MTDVGPKGDNQLIHVNHQGCHKNQGGTGNHKHAQAFVTHLSTRRLCQDPLNRYGNWLAVVFHAVAHFTYRVQGGSELV